MGDAPTDGTHDPSADTARVPPAGEGPMVAGPRRRRWPERVAEASSLTPRQRRGMLALLAVVFATLLFRAVRDGSYVADPQPAEPARFGELADRLDPNTASWEELVALPQLGEKRAKAVVEHREDWARRHPGDPAYKEPLDLVAVRGIGASMVETLSPYLTFPASAATGPATRVKP